LNLELCPSRKVIIHTQRPMKNSWKVSLLILLLKVLIKPGAGSTLLW
jgi:hypothetical protein